MTQTIEREAINLGVDGSTTWPKPIAPPVPTLVIAPSQGWGRLGLHDVWEYRELLYFLLWREVKGRYRQMAFGPLWIIIQPLVNIVIFSFIFGQLAKLPSEGVPYPIFTYVALLPWQFFANGTRNSAGSLLSQQSVIDKVYWCPNELDFQYHRQEIEICHPVRSLPLV